MARLLSRWLVLVLLLVPGCALHAEKVADLPMPTHYVNDFAHVLTPEGAQRIENLSLAVHRQANAELVLVTISKLEDDQSVEEFTTALEEKWKLGKKGEDRSALYLIVLNPKKLRIETGYGLEGMLNDAKVGAILDQALPYARQGDYNQAGYAGISGLAQVVAADAGVTLTQVVPRRQMQRQRQQVQFGIGHLILGAIVLVVLFSLIKTGNIGWAFFLLQALMGGGGRGGGFGGGDDNEGGGFGGSGGGSSGGGGASRDF